MSRTEERQRLGSRLGARQRSVLRHYHLRGRCAVSRIRIQWAPDLARCARLPFLKSLPAKLGHLLVLYGGWGLFAISFLDSSILSFPLVNDLLLIDLSSRHPDRMLVYVLQCTAGSVLGAYVIYGIARGGGEFLWRRSSSGKMSRARRWVERNDFVAILVASLLPPPTPFKIFPITAGLLRANPGRFGAALLVGRSLRFAGEGLMAVRYGARAEAYLKKHIVWISLVTVALIVGITLVYRQFRSRAGDEPPPTRAGSSASDAR